MHPTDDKTFLLAVDPSGSWAIYITSRGPKRHERPPRPYTQQTSRTPGPYQSSFHTHTAPLPTPHPTAPAPPPTPPLGHHGRPPLCACPPRGRWRGPGIAGAAGAQAKLKGPLCLVSCFYRGANPAASTFVCNSHKLHLGPECFCIGLFALKVFWTRLAGCWLPLAKSTFIYFWYPPPPPQMLAIHLQHNSMA